MSLFKKEKPYQKKYCPNCKHETYFSGNKCECCKNIININGSIDIPKPINTPHRIEYDGGKRIPAQLDVAKDIARERMRELCISCANQRGIKCPIESVLDLETIYALVPENCKRFEPKFVFEGRVR